VLHGNIHRHLLTLSLINWGIAIVCWAISAWLGISQPASIFVYTILFVVGLIAAIVAVLSFVLADFGTEPGAPVAVPAGPPDSGAPKPAADTGA
jgi:hypothetical protein